MAEIPEHPEDGSTGTITGTVVFDGGKEEWVMHWHYVGISRTGSNGVVRRCAAQGPRGARGDRPFHVLPLPRRCSTPT